MPQMRRFLFVLVVALAAARPAAAQQPLSLQFHDGRVTLHAQNVPVRAILAEWARVGDTRVVNAERVGGAPVTLDLENVSERQALDILLRNVAGYVLALRPPAGNPSSTFNRILILPTSAAPRFIPAQATPAGNAFRPPQPSIAPLPDDPEEEPITDVPQPGFGPQQPGFVPQQPGVTPQPLTQPGFRSGSQTGVQQGGQAPAPVTTSPTNPFGVPSGSGAQPGVVTPVPPPQQPTGQVVRPLQD